MGGELKGDKFRTCIELPDKRYEMSRLSLCDESVNYELVVDDHGRYRAWLKTNGVLFGSGNTPNEAIRGLLEEIKDFLELNKPFLTSELPMPTEDELSAAYKNQAEDEKQNQFFADYLVKIREMIFLIKHLPSEDTFSTSARILIKDQCDLANQFIGQLLTILNKDEGEYHMQVGKIETVQEWRAIFDLLLKVEVDLKDIERFNRIEIHKTDGHPSIAQLYLKDCCIRASESIKEIFKKMDGTIDAINENNLNIDRQWLEAD